MSEPTKEQLEKWREDFEDYFKGDHDFFKSSRGGYLITKTNNYWQGYLAAKKSDFLEIESWKDQAKFYEQDRDEKDQEIKSLKEQLAEAVALLNKSGSSCTYIGLGIDFESCDCWHHIRQRFLEKQENKDEK